MFIALLFMVIIVQIGLTFAAITPTNTSALHIITPDLAYNLAEGERVKYSVIVANKIELDVVWNSITSDDLSLSQTGTIKTNKTVKR